MKQTFTIGIQDSAAVVPTSIGNIRSWSRDCLETLAMKRSDHYTDVVNMLLVQLPNIDFRSVLTEGISKCGDEQFLYTEDQSQFDIALKALRKLCANDEISNSLIYSHSSIEEAVYASNASRLAAAMDWSSRPHFALSQMGSVSFFQALKIIDQSSNFTVDEFSVYCSAERWPKPYPRSKGSLDPLSDGACALRISRSDQARLKLLQIYQEGCEPFLSLEQGKVSFDSERMKNFAMGALDRALENVSENLSVKIVLSCPSKKVADAIYKDSNLRFEPLNEKLGYFASADVTYMVHQVVEQLKVEPMSWIDDLLLFCGISSNGNFGAALFSPH
ncbi:hypothetical protein [Pseudobacteriovorax antillogorgiicola]|uniref:3-oxoacyl-[acyl-carrier-protein] synthase III n=1 Tax=Pseudobacteriovorax antillogorgiicola TaxID=1513793 RepID=A0A1Y6C539_9BACT|nr:hypothetical protein [Pseudobacteriovorax antillogorgiicola]TCS51195.1 hypothetical protein EDD56_11179 [Pseudobacteriovorax antillogorgiicola]SMF37490.1 hypothetical protein SAMN06296036_11199 [Pseudobacteriovorax antillogorgiicola]